MLLLLSYSGASPFSIVLFYFGQSRGIAVRNFLGTSLRSTMNNRELVVLSEGAMIRPWSDEEEDDLQWSNRASATYLQEDKLAIFLGIKLCSYDMKRYDFVSAALPSQKFSIWSNMNVAEKHFMRKL